MEIREIHTLRALRDVFATPEERREEVFTRELMEPIRPVWERAMQHLGHAPSGGAPALIAARALRLYTPDLGADRALAALDALERAGAWEASVGALRRAIEALQPRRHGIPLERVHFAFTLAHPEGLGEEGYTGSGNVPGWVVLSAWPTAQNLPKLPAVVAHELNHTVRFHREPFPLTLGQYAVAEGVAEAFAAELCGEAALGPWATAVRGAALDALKPRFRTALHERDFAVVRGYIFGDAHAAAFGYAAQGVPAYAGYAIGYHIVRAYLSRTGTTAAEAPYAPWQEIVEASGVL